MSWNLRVVLSEIHTKCRRGVAPGEEARYEPTTGLAYLLMKLREAQGES